MTRCARGSLGLPCMAQQPKDPPHQKTTRIFIIHNTALKKLVQVVVCGVYVGIYQKVANTAVNGLNQRVRAMGVANSLKYRYGTTPTARSAHYFTSRSGRSRPSCRRRWTSWPQLLDLRCRSLTRSGFCHTRPPWSRRTSRGRAAPCR